MHVAVNPDIEVSSQSPAFLRSVNERMEAYRERLAAKVRAEMAQRGEGPGDLAYNIGVEPRTVERWLAGESEPRRRNFKAMSEHWGVPITELRPDLEEEERQLQAQLDRIEAKLDVLLAHHGLTGPVEGPGEGPLLPDTEAAQTSPKAGAPKAGRAKPARSAPKR